MKLYEDKEPEEGEKELFGDKDTIEVESGKSYWLQGGSEPSIETRDEYLHIHAIEGESEPPCDWITATVLWVDIKGVTSGNHKLSPLNDDYDNIMVCGK